MIFLRARVTLSPVLKERELLAEKRVLEAEIAERQVALNAVEILLNRIRQQSGTASPDSPVVPAGRSEDGKRVRGTLKAAKRAAESFDEPFTRAGLFAKVETANPGLAGKISAEAQRSTMRTLLKEGWIFVASEASETSEATYRTVRLAAAKV